jgi:hypothetical protein
VLRQEVDDRLAIRDPERDVIEGLGLHAASVPVRYRSRDLPLTGIDSAL